MHMEIRRYISNYNDIFRESVSHVGICMRGKSGDVFVIINYSCNTLT